jgi:hypothetical protein
LVVEIFTTTILCAFHFPASTSIADKLESKLRPLPSGFSARKHRLDPKPWSYSQNLLYAGRLSVVLPNLRLRRQALGLRCPVNTQSEMGLALLASSFPDHRRVVGGFVRGQQNLGSICYPAVDSLQLAILMHSKNVN